jgi:hypothetical protein
MLRANCESQCSVMVWELSGAMSCEWGGAPITASFGAGPPQPVGGVERHYCSARDNVGGEVAWNMMTFGTQTRAECDASCRDASTSRRRSLVCRWGQTTAVVGVLGQGSGGATTPTPTPTPARAPTAACTLETRGMPSQYVGDGMIQENCLLQCEIIGLVFGGATTCVWGSTTIASRTATPPVRGAFCTAHENVPPSQPWTLTRLGDLPIMGDCNAACGAEANRRRQSMLCTYGSTAFTVSGP